MNKLVLLFFVSLILMAGRRSEASDRDGSIIDSIVIINKNIFDLDSAKFDTWPYRMANKIHIITRQRIIRQELLLKKGDPYSAELARESERNLKNLDFLWNAKIIFEKNSDGKNILRVITNDRWTISGGISLKRNSGENSVHMHFEESNLFGLGKYVSWNYFVRDYDDDFMQFSYVDRRFAGSWTRMSLYCDRNPEAGLTGITLQRPYYSLDSWFSYYFNMAQIDRRQDYYRDGVIGARNFVEGHQIDMYAGMRIGERYDKVRFGMRVNYKSIDVRIAYDSLGVEFPTDSHFVSIRPEIGIDNFRYVKKRRIRSFTLADDILLQRGGTFGAGRSFDKDGTMLYDELVMILNYDFTYNSNLVFMRSENKFWYNDGIDLRKRLNLSILYYNNGLSWLTTVMNLSYYHDFRDDSTEAVYLGENSGLRGTPRNYLTGERRLLLNWENRIYTGIEIMSIHLGLAQFLDVGQVWSREEEYGADNYYWSIGGGLRIGTEKLSSSRVARFDLAYSLSLKQWEISFGLGQYIGLPSS